jgi:hypothetical protein
MSYLAQDPLFMRGFDFQRQRLINKLNAYKNCPPELAYGEMTYRIALGNAERALRESNDFELRRVYAEMREIE